MKNFGDFFVEKTALDNVLQNLKWIREETIKPPMSYEWYYDEDSFVRAVQLSRSLNRISLAARKYAPLDTPNFLNLRISHITLESRPGGTSRAIVGYPSNIVNERGSLYHIEKNIESALNPSHPKDTQMYLNTIFNNLSYVRARTFTLELNQFPPELAAYFNHNLDVPLTFDYMDKLANLKPKDQNDGIVQMLNILASYPGLERIKLPTIKLKRKLGFYIDPKEIDDKTLVDLI